MCSFQVSTEVSVVFAFYLAFSETHIKEPTGAHSSPPSLRTSHKIIKYKCNKCTHHKPRSHRLKGHSHHSYTVRSITFRLFTR